jgi:protein TonB
MRSLQFALLCFICTAKSNGQTVTNSYGQIVVEITKEKRPKKIYTKVEIKSAFPGGDSAWIKSLEENLDRSIPFHNGAKTGKYIVSVAFIIVKDGSISEVRCLSDPGFGMGQEVVRAIKKGTKWAPAPAGGIKVRVVNAYSQ